MANDDLISRQAAIEAIEEYIDEYNCLEDGYHNPKWCAMQEAKMTIQRLPSAERRGRWIENEFGAYCSECGLYAYRSNGIPWKSNYCPMCGARLEATK